MLEDETYMLLDELFANEEVRECLSIVLMNLPGSALFYHLMF